MDVDDDLPAPALRDRLMFGLFAGALATLPAYLAWWIGSRFDGFAATIVVAAIVAASVLFAFARPQSLPEPFLRLVEAIRWAGRG